jgi:hypothetical protein
MTRITWNRHEELGDPRRNANPPVGKEDQVRGLILALLVLSLGGQAQAALSMRQIEGRISRVGVGTHTA